MRHNLSVDMTSLNFVITRND